MEKEIIKLQSKLLIPISKLEFNDSHVKIYSAKGKYINNIPALSLGGIIYYDLAEESVKKLDWLAIYNDNKEEIDKKAKELSSNKIKFISPTTFRKINIHYSKGQTKSAHCIFHNNSWQVFLEE